jgi:uncharacterized protein
MKRAIIVHCWSGRPDYCWYPKTKKELELLGFDVQIPAMPETDEPKLSLWLPKLEKVIGNPDKNLYLIGHSIGVATIMRYLENLPESIQIGGAVFVAGFTDNLNFDEIKNFFETPIDYEKVRSSAEKFVLIHSDNDPYVQLSHGLILRDKLDAELIVKKNMGHFSGEADEEESCLDLPEVTEAIRRMA